jgi:tryptophanyl-tRNA synthetase
MLARRVNEKVPNLFVVPEPVIGKTGARVMGLDNPEAKMSKSAASEYNFVSFADDPDMIRKKIKKAVTDSGSTIEYDPEKRPAIANLLTIYSAMTGTPVETLVENFKGKGFGDFKKDLAEAVVAHLAPIQERFKMHLDNQKALEQILSDGAEKARAIAQPKMAQIRKALGLGR